ncbi:SDR family NAD(P)-dependent oxidoreductase [Nitrincola alkalisediminis]|uniref:SDR family NAD(P)-dependent oxidoreductase n=1 Tax=Nitrincola alkalisediminis TaxID=1366656 RepID=UPI001874088A|nr:SDR family oxidoreductase [Nitrincola alkalisediminis]
MQTTTQTKTILITGATAGIGLAAAQSLLQQGARLVITGRDQERLDHVVTMLGGSVIPMLCDSANIEHIQQMASQLQQDNIKLDGLILNAGVFYPAPFEQMTVDNFNTTMAINFSGPVFTLQSLLPCLNNPSSVVFISTVAVQKAFSAAGVYSASKAAFEGFARVLNLELAVRNIRINSIRPGVTATEIQSKAGMDDATISDFFESLSSTPVGRVLTPSDIIPAINYLVSDASMGLRNAYIDIDGGFGL